jgi:hypothetical protein
MNQQPAKIRKRDRNCGLFLRVKDEEGNSTIQIDHANIKPVIFDTKCNYRCCFDGFVTPDFIRDFRDQYRNAHSYRSETLDTFLCSFIKPVLYKSHVHYSLPGLGRVCRGFYQSLFQISYNKLRRLRKLKKDKLEKSKSMISPIDLRTQKNWPCNDISIKTSSSTIKIKTQTMKTIKRKTKTTKTKNTNTLSQQSQQEKKQKTGHSPLIIPPSSQTSKLSKQSKFKPKQPKHKPKPKQKRSKQKRSKQKKSKQKISTRRSPRIHWKVQWNAAQHNARLKRQLRRVLLERKQTTPKVSTVLSKKQLNRKIYSKIVDIVIEDELQNKLVTSLQRNVLDLIFDVNGMRTANKKGNNVSMEADKYRGPIKQNFVLLQESKSSSTCSNPLNICPKCIDEECLHCLGCEHCFNCTFTCNNCRRTCTIVATYEKGCGRSTSGCDKDYFQVQNATVEMKQLGNIYEHVIDKPLGYYNTASHVVYTPDDVCVRCICNRECNTAKDKNSNCSSELNGHCDLVHDPFSPNSSKNSQADGTDNMSYSQGATHDLFMQRIIKTKGRDNPVKSGTTN